MVYIFHTIKVLEDKEVVVFYAVATSQEDAVRISVELEHKEHNFCTTMVPNEIYMDGKWGVEHNRKETT